MDIYLGRKQTQEFNLGLGQEVSLQLTKDLDRSFCTIYFENFLKVQIQLKNYFKEAFMVLEMIGDKHMKRGDPFFR